MSDQPKRKPPNPVLAEMMRKEIAATRAQCLRDLAINDLTLDEHDNIVPMVAAPKPPTPER